MNFKDFEDHQKKFKTLHRDDMYHVIRENDKTGLFASVADTFLIAFAIGFHRDVRSPVRGSGAINHVNANAIPDQCQDIVIVLVLDRHPEITDRGELWDLVEEYAEGGIKILFESLSISEWLLDVQSLLADD